MSAYVFHFGGGAASTNARAKDKTIVGGKGYQSLLNLVYKFPDGCASFCFLKTECHIGAAGLGPHDQGVLLFLVAIVFDDACFQ